MTNADERVIIPVAPERDTGMSGAPIIIDLRSSHTASAALKTIDRAPTQDERGAPDDFNGALPDQPVTDGPVDTPRPNPGLRDRQLVTVEDLKESSRALRRENAELTAMINTIRSEMQTQITRRDRELAELQLSSNQAVARANSQLAAAHMQIDIAGGSESTGMPAPVLVDLSSQTDDELRRIRDAHAAERASLMDDLERAQARQRDAVAERDAARAACDELAKERDRVQAANIAVTEEKKLAQTAHLTEFADMQSERYALQQQLADTKVERDELRLQIGSHGPAENGTHNDELRQELVELTADHADLGEQLTKTAAERDKLHQALADITTASDEREQELRDLATERDEREQELRDLAAERDELQQALAEAREAQETTSAEAATRMHAALAERDREQAVGLHQRDTQIGSLHDQLAQTRAELTRAHESLAAISAQDDAAKVDELSAELAIARAELADTNGQLSTIEADVDDRVQRAFEAGSQLGERAAERLARLLPTDAY